MKSKKERKYHHLAISKKNKKAFDFLKSYLINEEKTEITQDELLEDMMRIYKEHKPLEKENDTKK